MSEACQALRYDYHSASVSWRTLMGYPSYERNRACALPSPLSFHYVIAKIVPAVQVAAMVKVEPCTDARTVVNPTFFRLKTIM